MGHAPAHNVQRKPQTSTRSRLALVVAGIPLLADLSIGNSTAFGHMRTGIGSIRYAEPLQRRTAVTKLRARGGEVGVAVEESPKIGKWPGPTPAPLLEHDPDAVIASGPFAFDNSNIDTIKMLFGWMDQKRRGKITRDELYNGYRSVNGPFSLMNKKSVNFVFDEVDANEDGFVDLGEFALWTQDTNQYMLNFAQSDLDEDGLIDFEGFKEVLEREAFDWPAPLPRMFNTIDQDKDGLISLWQFIGASRLRSNLRHLSQIQLEDLCVLQYPQNQIDDTLAEDDPKVAIVELIIKNHAMHW